MPHISIVTPVYKPDLDTFRACARSVLAQISPSWQWCLFQDGAHDGPTAAELKRMQTDERVVVGGSDENRGIAAATNGAISTATGEFVAFLDQDDVLHPSALRYVSLAILDNPDVDVIYTDEDKIDQSGKHLATFRKPRWSPERLRHQNYVSHLTVIRRSLVEELGGLRPEFDGSQDYDLILRATERARQVVHIPKVLYHWRMSPSSTAQDPNSKPAAHRAAVRAVEEHCSRVGLLADVELMENYYVRVKRKNTWTPKVSIVVPSRGSRGKIGTDTVVLVENCIESILRMSTYPDFEIVVVLDAESPAAVRQYLLEQYSTSVKIVNYPEDFNFSDKINRGVVASSGEVVIALNDDTQVISPSWIEELIGHLVQPDVGMVGPLLLLDDGRVQSAGHFYEAGAHHVAAGVLSSENGPFGVLTFPAERSGLTFACTAFRRSVFEYVGGLSIEFPRAFNDVDFGNKLLMSDMRIVWTPDAVLYHFESLTRDPRVEEFEVARLYARWGHLINARDPYVPSFRRQFRGM